MSYWMLGAMVVTTAYGAYSSNQNAKKSLKQQEDAQGQARQDALKQEKAADEAANAANRKAPDIGSILADNSAQAKGGVSSTMLTGAQGVDPNKLQLGKVTLLGQ